MNKIFSLLIYVKRAKAVANSTALFITIIIDGKITRPAVKRKVQPEKWNPAGQKVTAHLKKKKPSTFILKL